MELKSEHKLSRLIAVCESILPFRYGIRIVGLFPASMLLFTLLVELLERAW